MVDGSNCKCPNVDDFVHANECKNCSDPLVIAQNLAECVVTPIPPVIPTPPPVTPPTIPTIPTTTPIPESNLDIEWTMTTEFPGDKTIFDQIPEADENSMLVYMNFVIAGDLGVEFLQSYNYQKNLKISDPLNNKKIENVSLETTFFSSFMLIELVNIHKQVFEPTKEI